MLNLNKYIFGFAAWMVKDGNFTDFSTGEFLQFSILCAIIDYEDGYAEKSIYEIEKNIYIVNGEITYINNNIIVIDFGFPVFSLKTIIGKQRGDFICAIIELEVDPFYYKEELVELPQMPPLTKNWRVNKILMANEIHNHIYSKDIKIKKGSYSHYVEINRTNAHNDNGGHGSYLIECTMM